MLVLESNNINQNTESKIRHLVYTCPIDHTGSSVFVKGFLKEGNKLPPIILVHDLGEVATKFNYLAGKLVEKGHNVYTFDMRGHGRSGRLLGHVPKFDLLTRDLLQVVAWVKHKENGQKPNIFSHGIGCLVALSFARSYGTFCHSLVLVSPTFRLSEKIASYKRFIIKALSDFSLSFMLPQKIIPIFTYDPFHQKKAFTQPKISAAFALQLLTVISQSKKLLTRNSIATLIIYSKDDPICKYDALKRIVSKKNKKASNYTIKVIEAEIHRLLTSDEKYIDQVLSFFLEWMSSNTNE